MKRNGKAETEQAVRRAVLKTRREALKTLALFDFGVDDAAHAQGNRRVRSAVEMLQDDWREADHKTRTKRRK